MIEVMVPFVLVLMSWNADDPQGSMRVSHHVYVDEATCLKAGRERQELAENQSLARTDFAWRCTPHKTQIEVYRPLRTAE